MEGSERRRQQAASGGRARRPRHGPTEGGDAAVQRDLPPALSDGAGSRWVQKTMSINY